MGGMYIIRYNEICESLKKEIFEDVIMEKYGFKGVRIVRLLYEKSKLDEKAIVNIDESFRSSPKAYRINERGFCTNTRSPRSADRAPSRTFYLWDIDYKKCYDVLLNNYHQHLLIYIKKIASFSIKPSFGIYALFLLGNCTSFHTFYTYAIPPTAPPIIPPTISLYIRPSVPLSVSPITCIERSKQGVTFNRELFALIGGVFVFCSFALGNHWSLKNQIGSEKERQESISKEILAKLKEQKEVNEVNEAIEVVNEINEVNEDK
ncbi:unnamed protein product [Rhizophagus irregularis]|nr:unnamed protein product [Rhizophagus irregularis]